MLQTHRLTLRGPRQADLDAMFAIYSDPQNMRFWSTPPHATPDVTQIMLSERIVAFASNPVNFILDLDGRMIGNAGMFREWEVGFMLHHPYHRQGYVSEAMQMILPHIWQVTRAQSLTADADPNNIASVGLLRRLGFAQTHHAKNTFFINGIWYDSVYLKLDRPAAQS